MPSHKSKPTRVLDDVSKQVKPKYSDAMEKLARESGYKSAEEADYVMRQRERKNTNPEAKRKPAAKAAPKKPSGGVFDRINNALRGRN